MKEVSLGAISVAVVAAHTDDAEVCAGGTILNLTSNGHTVRMINMVAHAGQIRLGSESAKKAGAEVSFLDFVDREIVDEPDSFKKLSDLLDGFHPDVILTHWPVDDHADHRATASMCIRYVVALQYKHTSPEGTYDGGYCPQLMFYEAITGQQTKCFNPDLYICLSQEIFENKKKLMEIYAGKEMTTYSSAWFNHHIMMMRFRAAEHGVCRHGELTKGVYAESFALFPVPPGCSRISLPGEY